MSFARVVGLALVFAAALSCGTGSASAANTVGSSGGQATAETSAFCSGPGEDQHSDSQDGPAGNGPFNFSVSANPQTASTPGCAVGSGNASASTSGHVAGSVDPSTGTLKFDATGDGTSTASQTYTGNPQHGDCVSTNGGTTLGYGGSFTISQPEPFSFTGSASVSGPNADGSDEVDYQLATNNGTHVFDQSRPPGFNGTLPAGTYSWSISATEKSLIFDCTKSGSATDKFHFDLHLNVGAVSHHYRVEFKAWIPFDHVVDPYQPNPLLFVDPQFQGLLHTLLPGCSPFPPTRTLLPTQVETTFRGDSHFQVPGSFRVHLVAEFDWDPATRTMSNFTLSPDATNYGTTHLDYTFSSVVPPFPPVATCSAAGTATTSTLGSKAFGGSGFLLRYSSSNPLVSPQFAVPAIDGRLLGNFDAHSDLHLAFSTDGFPSHGVEVTRDGVVQEDAIVNDASCLDPDSVLSLPGIALLTLGLSDQANIGSFVVPQNASGLLGARSSFLCRDSYDMLSVASSSGSGGPVAEAAATSGILVAPASGGKFVPLAQAIKSGLVSGVKRGRITLLLVDQRHPVRIRVTGRGVVVQDAAVKHGHLGGGVRFGPVAGTLAVLAAKTLKVSANGHKLKARKPDHKPPRTTAKVTIEGKFAVVHVHATDASGVARTILVVGNKPVKLKHGSARINRAQLKTVRYYSIDVLGNSERPRRLRR